MDVVAREHSDLEAGVVVVELVPLNLIRFIQVVPIDTEHTALRIFSNGLKNYFRLLSNRIELIELLIGAVMVRYDALEFLAISLSIHPEKILDISRITFSLLWMKK